MRTFEHEVWGMEIWTYCRNDLCMYGNESDAEGMTVECNDDAWGVGVYLCGEGRGGCPPATVTPTPPAASHSTISIRYRSDLVGASLLVYRLSLHPLALDSMHALQIEPAPDLDVISHAQCSPCMRHFDLTPG